MKDKAARDAREAHLRWVEEETRYKYVEVSPKNRTGGDSWSGNFVINGRQYFRVMLLPPRSSAEGDWKIVCTGTDDFAIERVVKTRNDAIRVYENINPFTERATLYRRGFRPR